MKAFKSFKGTIVSTYKHLTTIVSSKVPTNRFWNLSNSARDNWSCSVRLNNLLQQFLCPRVGPVDVDVGDVRLAADLVQLLVLSLDLPAHGLGHFLQV